MQNYCLVSAKIFTVGYLKHKGLKMPNLAEKNFEKT